MIDHRVETTLNLSQNHLNNISCIKIPFQVYLKSELGGFNQEGGVG